MNRAIRWINYPPVTGPASTLLIRLLPGAIFGCQSIAALFLKNPGTDRVYTYVLAISELLGSFMLAVGLCTRITALFLVIHAIVTVLFTKIAGAGIRCDYAQIISCFFLMLEGPGRWSVDFYIYTHRQPIFKINQKTNK